MPGTVLDSRNIAMNETETISAFLEFMFQWEEKEDKQINTLVLQSQVVRKDYEDKKAGKGKRVVEALFSTQKVR